MFTKLTDTTKAAIFSGLVLCISETRMQCSAWIIPPKRFCGAHRCFRVSKPVLRVMVLKGYSLR